MNTQKKTPQAPKVRALLNEAARAIKASRQSLFQAEPDYAASLTESLQATRRAFQAFITWHELALPEDAPLHDLARRAVPLASMLRTCAGRTLPLEPLARELLAQCDCSRISNKQPIRSGYYAARNTFYTVLDELPAGFLPEPPVPRSEAFAQ